MYVSSDTKRCLVENGHHVLFKIEKQYDSLEKEDIFGACAYTAQDIDKTLAKISGYRYYFKLVEKGKNVFADRLQSTFEAPSYTEIKSTKHAQTVSHSSNFVEGFPILPLKYGTNRIKIRMEQGRHRTVERLSCQVGFVSKAEIGLTV